MEALMSRLAVTVHAIVAAMLAVLPAMGQNAPGRHVFDLKALRALRWEIQSRAPVTGVEGAVQAVVMTMKLPEGKQFGLEEISRLFLLDANDGIVFDSFAWDRVSEGVEPSVNTRTFFELKWSLAKPARGRPAYLTLSGKVPVQAPGDPVRAVFRTTVIAWTGKAFEEVVDVRAQRPAITGPGEVRVLY